MGPLDFLGKITILLLIGVIVGHLARRFKLPSMLLLILTGLVMSNINVDGTPVISFDDSFLISTGVLALVMIVFDGSSKFNLRELDSYSESALKIAIVFLVLNMIFLSVATHFLFNISNVILSMIFAAVMSGTDPGAVLSLFQTKSNKVIEILKYESVINTPIVVLIPFILLDLMKLGDISNFSTYFYPFIQQIITGIGTGVFVGLIVFRFMRKVYSEKFSPLTLITSALLTYILADNLGGNGVLAVTVLGVFFATVRVKKKYELQGFSTMFSNILEILMFVLIGFLIPVRQDSIFLIKSLILFGIMLLLRFITMQLIFMKDHVNLKERIFMTLNCTKGIAVAVVAFILSNYVFSSSGTVFGELSIPLLSLQGSKTIIDLIVLFIVYSIVTSSIAAKMSEKLVRVKVEE